MFKYLVLIFIATCSIAAGARQNNPLELPPYCAEFTQVAKDNQNVRINDGDRSYQLCSGGSLITLDERDFVDSVNDIVGEVDANNKDKMFFQTKDQLFKAEADNFKKKLLTKAVSNLKTKKRDLLGIYPDIKTGFSSFTTTVYNTGFVREEDGCSTLKHTHKKLSKVLDEDEQLSKELQEKLEKPQEDFLEFYLVNAISNRARHTHIKKEEARLEKKLKEELTKYRSSSALNNAPGVQECWDNNIKKTRGYKEHSGIIKDCTGSLIKSFKEEKKAKYEGYLGELRINFAKDIESVPLLYNSSDSFKITDWVNQKPKPSDLSNYLTRDLDQSKLEEFGAILLNEESSTEKINKFKEKHPEMFDVTSKLKDPKNQKQLKKAVQKQVKSLEDSANNLCSKGGDNLHNFTSLVDDLFSDNRSEKELLEDIAGQCYLLQKYPFKNTDVTWITLAGTGAVVVGSVLQIVPVAGNIAGLTLIGAGTTAIVGEGAVNYERAARYEEIARALKDTNHITFDEYLEFKEDRSNKRNDLVLEGALLVGSFGLVKKGKDALKARSILKNPTKRKELEARISDSLHEDWLKNFRSVKAASPSRLRIKEVPSSVLLDGETAAEAVRRLSYNKDTNPEGFKGLSAPYGKLLQNINQKSSNLIPELKFKLNGKPVSDYVDAVVKKGKLKKDKDVEEMASEIHEIWMKHNQDQIKHSPHLFRPYSELSAVEKAKDLDVLKVLLKDGPTGISRKTERLLDTYKSNLLSNTKPPNIFQKGKVKLDKVKVKFDKVKEGLGKAKKNVDNTIDSAKDTVKRVTSKNVNPKIDDGLRESEKILFINRKKKKVPPVREFRPGNTYTLTDIDGTLYIGKNIEGTRGGNRGSHEALWNRAAGLDGIPLTPSKMQGSMRINKNGGIDISGFHGQRPNEETAKAIADFLRKELPDVDIRWTGDRLDTLSEL